jgi:hypothetical protein
MKAKEFLTLMEDRVERGDQVFGFFSIPPYTWVFATDENPPMDYLIKVKLLPFEGFHDDVPYIVATSLSDLKGLGEQPSIRWTLVENYMEARMLATVDHERPYFPVDILSKVPSEGSK